MTEPDTDDRTTFRRWYDEVFWPLYVRWTPAVLAACVIFSLFAMVSTYLQQRTQERVTATLLDCFDTYADNTYQVSKEVRAAQVKADAAESQADGAAADRDAAFQEVLTLILTQNDDQAEGIRVFTALQQTNALLVRKRRALVEVRAELAQTRKEHPPAKPPSTFCELPD